MVVVPYGLRESASSAIGSISKGGHSPRPFVTVIGPVGARRARGCHSKHHLAVGRFLVVDLVSGLAIPLRTSFCIFIHSFRRGACTRVVHSLPPHGGSAPLPPQWREGLALARSIAHALLRGTFSSGPSAPRAFMCGCIAGAIVSPPGTFSCDALTPARHVAASVFARARLGRALAFPSIRSAHASLVPTTIPGSPS